MITASILSVSLTVLKVIGLVLGGVIALALLAALAILFVPIRYKVRFALDSEGEKLVSGLVRASWLLHILNFSTIVEGSQVTMKFRIFGITIKKSEDASYIDKTSKTSKVGNEKKEVNKEYIADKSLESKQNRKLIIEPMSSNKNQGEEAEIIEINVGENKCNVEILDDIFDEIKEDKIKAKDAKAGFDDKEDTSKKNIFEKIKNKFRRVLDAFRSFVKIIISIPSFVKNIILRVSSGLKDGYDKLNAIEDFINDKENIEAYKLAKKEFFFLIEHIKPTKIKGDINFGFESPAYTGKVLGLYYSIFPVSPKKFNLTGDFNKEVFKGNVMMRGHIRLNHLLMSFFRIKKNKRLTELFKKVTSR